MIWLDVLDVPARFTSSDLLPLGVAGLLVDSGGLEVSLPHPQWIPARIPAVANHNFQVRYFRGREFKKENLGPVRT